MSETKKQLRGRVENLESQVAELREHLAMYTHLVWELRNQQAFDQNAIGYAHRRVSDLEESLPLPLRRRIRRLKVVG